MKDQFLKVAGVKTEAEFYKRFPTEEAFFAKHGGEIPRMEEGAAAGQAALDAMIARGITPLTVDPRLTNPAPTPGMSYDIVGAAGGAISGALALMGNGTSGQKGAGIGGGIGAAAGALLGPAGSMIGGQLGSAIGGLIGGGADKRRMQKKYDEVTSGRYNRLELSANVNPYGTNDSFYAAEGGAPGETTAEEQGPKPTKVNIEKGEIGIDPDTLDIIRKFDNKNRYNRHADNPMKEAIGNHVTVPDNMVIIPVKMAKRYEQGSKLTKRSILAELLKNQVNREHAETDQPQMRPGGATDPDNPRSIFPNQWQQGYNLNDYAQNPSMLAEQMRNPEADASVTGMKKPLVPRYNMGTYTGELPQTPQMQMSDQPEDTGDETQYGLDWKWPHVSGVSAARASSMIPTMYGLATAFGGDPYLQYNENDNFGAAQGMLEQMPTDINIEPQKAAIARTARGYSRQLNNINSPSIRAENASNYSKVIDAQGELYGNADNERRNRISQKLQSLSALKVAQGDNREKARDRFTTALEQDKANREMMVQQGLSEMSTNYSKQVMDNERIRSMNALSRYFKINPTGRKLFEQNPGAVMDMIDQVTTGGLPNFTTPQAEDDVSTTEKRNAYGRVVSTSQTRKSARQTKRKGK